jgi:hypothetical protein
MAEGCALAKIDQKFATKPKLEAFGCVISSDPENPLRNP